MDSKHVNIGKRGPTTPHWRHDDPQARLDTSTGADDFYIAPT